MAMLLKVCLFYVLRVWYSESAVSEICVVCVTCNQPENMCVFFCTMLALLCVFKLNLVPQGTAGAAKMQWRNSFFAVFVAMHF